MKRLLVSQSLRLREAARPRALHFLSQYGNRRWIRRAACRSAMLQVCPRHFHGRIRTVAASGRRPRRSKLFQFPATALARSASRSRLAALTLPTASALRFQCQQTHIPPAVPARRSAWPAPRAAEPPVHPASPPPLPSRISCHQLAVADQSVGLRDEPVAVAARDRPADRSSAPAASRWNQPRRVLSGSGLDGQAAVADGGGEAGVEGGHGPPGLLGGQQHAAVRQLQPRLGL